MALDVPSTEMVRAPAPAARRILNGSPAGLVMDTGRDGVLLVKAMLTGAFCVVKVVLTKAVPVKNVFVYVFLV